jgi:hypothetical protein
MHAESTYNAIPHVVSCSGGGNSGNVGHVNDNAVWRWPVNDAITFTGIPTAANDTSTTALLHIVSSDSTLSDASTAHNRVFTLSVASTADQSQLQLNLSASAMDHIKTHYIAPMKQRRQFLVQTLQQPSEHVSLETMLDKHMQELVYLSPVFIPIDDINNKTARAITCDTYSNSISGVRTTIDESQYPHIVFYIIPYSTASEAAIANDVLCGTRGDDTLTFVIRLPQGLALHPAAEDVAMLTTTWLSELAGFKADMFLLPDNW